MAGMEEDRATVHMRSYAPHAEAHVHDFHQLVLPLVGCLDLEIGGRGGQVVGATGALVPSGERHAFVGSRRNEFLVLDLPHALVEETGAGAWFDRVHRARFFPVTRAAARLAAWFAEEVAAVETPPAVTTAFATLLVRATTASAQRRVPDAVTRALAFIDERALAALSVSHVARAAGISVGQLQALFRAHIGRAPSSFIRARRLGEARRLLEETELPIAEVALRSGFADQASLTHAVRRVLGTTPGRLRRRRS
jgi:AraC-like DNA-binding protein